MITVGIDEVGRGSWAGPFLACAVVLDEPIVGLNDSKLLSPKSRDLLAAEIKLKALAIGFGWIEPDELDKIGLSQATTIAFEAALREITIVFDEVIIDGNFNYLSDNPKARAIVKADSLVPCVSAASILAKVERDNFMRRVAIVYPQYGFDKHVGYGTRYHQQKLQEYGPCAIHRLSFKPVKKVASSLNG